MTRNALLAITCAALLLTAPAALHAEESAPAPAAASAAASAPEGVVPPAADARAAAPEHDAKTPAGESGEPAAHETGHGEAAGGGHKGQHEDNISFFGKFSLPAEVWTLINLLLLISVLGYFLRGGMKKFFADRAAGIKAQLEEATNAKIEAEKRLKDLQSRMDALSGEVETLRSEAAQAADKLKEQILREAGEEATRLRQQAKDEIAAAEREARVRLQSAAAQEASKLALQMAGAKLQNEDHDRLIDGLADSLNENTHG